MHHMPVCWDAVGDLNTSPSKCNHYALSHILDRPTVFRELSETVTTHGAFFRSLGIGEIHQEGTGFDLKRRREPLGMEVKSEQHSDGMRQK